MDAANLERWSRVAAGTFRALVDQHVADCVICRMLHKDRLARSDDEPMMGLTPDCKAAVLETALKAALGTVYCLADAVERVLRNGQG